MRDYLTIEYEKLDTEYKEITKEIEQLEALIETKEKLRDVIGERLLMLEGIMKITGSAQ